MAKVSRQVSPKIRLLGLTSVVMAVRQHNAVVHQVKCLKQRTDEMDRDENRLAKIMTEIGPLEDTVNPLSGDPADQIKNIAKWLSYIWADQSSSRIAQCTKRSFAISPDNPVLWSKIFKLIGDYVSSIKYQSYKLRLNQLQLGDNVKKNEQYFIKHVFKHKVKFNQRTLHELWQAVPYITRFQVHQYEKTLNDAKAIIGNCMPSNS